MSRVFFCCLNFFFIFLYPPPQFFSRLKHSRSTNKQHVLFSHRLATTTLIICTPLIIGTFFSLPFYGHAAHSQPTTILKFLSKIFTMFKCQSIDGIDGQLLMEDYAQLCYIGEHVTYQLLAIIFLCLYVIGIPVSMFFLLWLNKKHLHDESSPKHHLIKNALGGMYTQYEQKYWWFEIFLLLNKSMMCGGLVMFQPGTSMQVLAAILIMLGHLLVILKLAPYESNGEDYSSILSALTLTLTTLSAFALMTDNPDPTKKTFDSDTLAYFMVGISVSCMASQIVIAVFFDCGLWSRLCSRAERREKGSPSSTTSVGSKKTQVVPVAAVDRDNALSARAKNAWD